MWMTPREQDLYESVMFTFFQTLVDHSARYGRGWYLFLAGKTFYVREVSL